MADERRRLRMEKPTHFREHVCWPAPLYMAARNGQLDLVAELLKDGAHVDTGGFDADTPLIASAERGDADVIRALLRARADVQATDKFGGTALHRAWKVTSAVARVNRTPHGRGAFLRSALKQLARLDAVQHMIAQYDCHTRGRMRGLRGRAWQCRSARLRSSRSYTIESPQLFRAPFTPTKARSVARVSGSAQTNSPHSGACSRASNLTPRAPKFWFDPRFSL